MLIVVDGLNGFGYGCASLKVFGRDISSTSKGSVKPSTDMVFDLCGWWIGKTDKWIGLPL